MKKLKTLFQGLGLICAMSSIVPAYGTITIQYEQPAVEGAHAQISKVLFSEGLKKEQEIPHVTLAQLVDEDRRGILERKSELLKSWKRFTIAQVATFAAATAAFMKHYINDDGVDALKRKASVQNLIQKINVAGAMKFQIAAYASLAALGVYPFVRYYKLFGLNEIDFYYPCEQVESKIVVFCRKTFSHSVRYGDTVIHYYNTSEPIGYMTLDEKEKEFKIIRQVNRRINISALNLTLCLGGLFWAATR